MVHYISQGEDILYNIVKLCLDKRSDVKNMPKHCAPGSSCFVIEDSSTWMLGSDGWHEVKIGGSSGGGSTTVSVPVYEF